MSGGEQRGVSSLTRTNIAVPASDPSNEGAVTNGVHAREDERDPSRDPAQTRVPAGLPSSVIHELRTPLTSIHGYAQVLQRALRDEPRATNALKIVVRETTRLSAMLSELSELAELESGDIVLTAIDVEAQQIVDGVVHEIDRRDANAHPIVIEGSGVARCNPTILSQVLLHVLTNAVRFSPPGSQVDVCITSEGDRIEILVADRGIEIPPGDGQRIYQPFERGSNAREAGVRGLGLGLYLARGELAHAGGTIQHEPRDGGGTVFRITVPAA
jgi:signal transduction histidine kinase